MLVFLFVCIFWGGGCMFTLLLKFYLHSTEN